MISKRLACSSTGLQGSSPTRLMLVHGGVSISHLNGGVWDEGSTSRHHLVETDCYFLMNIFWLTCMMLHGMLTQ